jgi:formylglycine-generating enzyme required for sulfatase activity
MTAALLTLAGCRAAVQEPAHDDAQAGVDVQTGEHEAGALAADQAPEAGDVQAAPAASGCPDAMVLIAGGITWMGTDFDLDEAPRHQVAVRSFCMDATEVTAASYLACVQAGTCTETHRGRSCTGWPKPGRDLANHPINCVDWNQADAACKAWGKRLPTEREWEFAASGGPERRRFSWGSADPSGRACYDLPGTCPVASYPTGAFGLHDMSGNVWEWTSSWFGPYPGEAAAGRLKVYRGGSYSRRFPRWMRTGLRNRFGPAEFGAHLGFRCAADLQGAECPGGSTPTATGCELPSHKDHAPSPSGPRPHAASTLPAASVSAAPPAAPEPAVLTRDPRCDDDCQKYKPGRPVCHLIKGGSFAERQKIGGGRGCVNRDVGIGYNSICCAQ